MKVKVSLFILSLVLGITSVVPVPAQQSKFTIHFTVLDENKNFLDSLKPSDIQIKQRKRILTIDSLEQTTIQNLDVVLMIDASLSQERMLPQVKQIAQNFIDSNLDINRDRVAVIRFAGEATVFQSLTNDFAAAKRNLDRIETASLKDRPPVVILDNENLSVNNKPLGRIPTATSLYDSVKNVSQRFFLNDKPDSRKVIILLTDGIDTFSENTRKAAIEASLKARVTVYAIGIADEEYNEVDKKSLNEISAMTSGMSVYPKKKDDLSLILRGIKQSLRSNYTLTFTALELLPEDKLQETKIEIVNPELQKRKLNIFQAKGYFTK